MCADRRRRRAAELLDQVGMTAWAEKRISKYSKGMLQRVGLAQAMGNSPDLIILDEPTDGVDPSGRRDIREVLRNLRPGCYGVHQQPPSQRTGNPLRSDGDPRAGQSGEAGVGQRTYRRTAMVCLRVRCAGAWNSVRAALPGTFGEGPPPLPGAPARGSLRSGQWCDFDGVALRVGIANPKEAQPVLDALRQHGLVIRRMQLIRPSLEDLFFEAVTDPETQRPLQPGAVGGRRA